MADDAVIGGGRGPSLSDIAETLENIERLLGGEHDGEEEADQAERAEMEARHERVRANTRRTRALAEKAQAKLDAERSRG